MAPAGGPERVLAMMRRTSLSRLAAWGFARAGLAVLMVLIRSGVHRRQPSGAVPADVAAAVRALAAPDPAGHADALRTLAARNDLWALTIADYVRDVPQGLRERARLTLARCRD